MSSISTPQKKKIIIAIEYLELKKKKFIGSLYYCFSFREYIHEFYYFLKRSSPFHDHPKLSTFK